MAKAGWGCALEEQVKGELFLLKEVVLILLIPAKYVT